MNKTEEPIIRRGLQMLAAITAEPWCPTDYRVGIERVRCDMLSLYTDAAEKKREEADELVNLSKAADTPWRPEVGKHPLLEGVGDYSAKQLRADAASEPEASIVPEWADCYACQGNGLAADGQDVCPHCDDGHISPRAQERLAGIQLTVFPWDPASDKHVYRVSIPGTEDVPTATVCWGVEVDEDATIERAYIVLGRIYSLHPEEVYATLVCCEPARRTLLAERPCSLMTLTSTDELLDLWGGRHGQNLQASVPGDDPDDQTTSPEDASLFDSMGPNFDPERAAGGELPPSGKAGSYTPSFEAVVQWAREHLVDQPEDAIARMFQDALAYRFGQGKAAAKKLVAQLEAEGIIARASQKAPWRLVTAQP